MTLCGPLAFKTCPVCSGLFSLEEFPKQKIGRLSRHTYCRKCYNAKRRESNKKVYSSNIKKNWNLKTRYGIDENKLREMIDQQKGKCALCGVSSTKLKVDHDHLTGVVRKLICHRCNIRMAGIDDEEWCEKALCYRDAFRNDV